MPDENDNKPNPAETFQRLLAQKNNDATALASQLFDENYQLRTKNRELSERLPKDGSVVLSSDEAKAFKAFQDLGVDPKDVKKALDRLPTLEKENRELAKMESLREVADLGIDGSKLKLSVLRDQLSSKFPDAIITFKEEKDKDGKTVKSAFVKKSEKDSEQSFKEFADAELADYLPSLKVSQEATPQIITAATPDPKSSNTPTSIFDRIRNETKAKSESAKPVPGMDIDSRFGRPANAA